MCGICGLFRRDGGPAEAFDVEAMNATLAHRGPDGDGVFVQGSVALGHRRLSIIDLEAGKQPMGTDDGSLQVVFNGEIYNYLELRRDLESRGHRFRTRSDTESILYAYREWGDDFVTRLRGMFAIALWDAREKRLVLARDRVGKKPLYYLLDDDRLLFGSELKAIVAVPGVPRDLDLEALDAYLSYGYVPSPLSIFRQIRKLPPGHVAVCTPDTFSCREYWRLDMDAVVEPGSEEAAVEELRAIFDEAVRIRLMSEVPLGAFLSGGLDSSAVVASMAVLMGTEPVKTASIGFAEKEFDELSYARLVAERYRTDHSEFVVKPDALGVLEKIVWHFDEPFADASAVPTWYVCQMARRKVTVALSGDGGDETFAGYVRRYGMTRFEDGIRRRLPGWFRAAVVGPAARLYPRADTLPRPLRLKRFLGNLSRSFEEAYCRDMSFCFSAEEKRSLYAGGLREATSHFDASKVLGRHLSAYRGDDSVTRAQYVDIKTYLPEDILVKVDRMSMAHSLEVRAPILDHKLMEFAARLPSSWKLRGSESKYLFKKMNEGRLPGDVLYRKKQGFSIPLAAWLRGELREYTRETLFSSAATLEDYFDVEVVRRLWEGHQGGREDNATPLWSLLMFGLWGKQFL